MNDVRRQHVAGPAAEADENFLGHEASLGAPVSFETEPHPATRTAVPSLGTNAFEPMGETGVSTRGKGGFYKSSQARPEHDRRLLLSDQLQC